jgi:hypothetical protein
MLNQVTDTLNLQERKHNMITGTSQLDTTCNVLLCADSWGVPHEGKGLVTHLNKYTSVENVSCGGYNNYDILDSMEQALAYHTYPIVIFIQSDLLRHRRESNDDVLPNRIDLKQILTERQKEILDRLESIQAMYNTKILCLGGLSRIDNYEEHNVQVVIPSILNFLDNTIDTEKYSVHDASGDLRLMGNLKHTNASVWLEATDNYIKKYNRMMKKDISICDGCHLNSDSFKKVADFLKYHLTIQS